MALKWHGDIVLDQIEGDLEEALNEAASVGAVRARRIIQVENIIDTTRYLRSISAKKAKRIGMSNEFQASYGSYLSWHIPYNIFLEFGTSRMRPRLVLTRSVDAVEARMKGGR